MNYVKVQTQDFKHIECYEKLHTTAKFGAIVTFTGIVRDFSSIGALKAIELEQYPKMTLSAMQVLADKAVVQFDGIGDIVLIHRVGYLAANEQIVFVGVSSTHRKSAFEAAQFIMDRLKNDVPLWKKEINTQGESHWVAVKDSDVKAGQQWG